MDGLKAISVKEAGQLKGTVHIQGSKNTILPIMAATLLASGVSVIDNCPMIEDVRVMCRLLECLQVDTHLEEHRLVIDTRNARYAPLPYSLTGRLRSSILLLGPILARWKMAQIGMPGGCSIGLRPIDIHLEGLVKMNVDFRIHKEELYCQTYHLQGCEYSLRFPSVGATENLILAATGAVGRTILRGAAREPEIIELCHYLCKMGVLIEGIGTETLVIKGSSDIQSCDYVNVYDRIVAGTYLLMAAAIPGDLEMTGIDDVQYIRNTIAMAARLGVNVIALEDRLHVQSGGRVCAGTFQTGIYPAFPTDLQPVLVAVLTRAEGRSIVQETVFEKRLAIVPELLKLHANIETEEQNVIIRGGTALEGHTVKATDLRQGAALVIAGMLSKGYTTITDISYIERGYEDIVTDLKGLGIEIMYI